VQLVRFVVKKSSLLLAVGVKIKIFVLFAVTFLRVFRGLNKFFPLCLGAFVAKVF
jgi:hypothetical protein